MISINDKENNAFNLYYRQLCFVAIAIIWLFTSGYLGIKYEGGWIICVFSFVIIGLFIDFLFQILKLFNCNISKNIKLIYLFFQIFVIVISYSSILYYLISIYSQDKA